MICRPPTLLSLFFELNSSNFLSILAIFLWTCIGGWINQGSYNEIRLIVVPRCLSRSTELWQVKHQCFLVHRPEYFSFFLGDRLWKLCLGFGLDPLPEGIFTAGLVCVSVCVCVCLKMTFSHWHTGCEVIWSKSWFTPLPWQWGKDLHLYQECRLRIVLQFIFWEGNSVAPIRHLLGAYALGKLHWPPACEVPGLPFFYTFSSISFPPIS